MKNVDRKILWAVLLSETSHLFCCVLPLMISGLSLMAGTGMISAMPGGLVWVHDLMHRYEVPMIIFSGVVLISGWCLWMYSRRFDCHDSGCAHAPCAPRKIMTRRILIAASVLFVVNIGVYVFYHMDYTHSQH